MVSPLDCQIDRPLVRDRKVKRRPEEEQQDRAPLHCREDYQTKAALAREKPGAAF